MGFLSSKRNIFCPLKNKCSAQHKAPQAQTLTSIGNQVRACGTGSQNAGCFLQRIFHSVKPNLHGIYSANLALRRSLMFLQSETPATQYISLNGFRLIWTKYVYIYRRAEGV